MVIIRMDKSCQVEISSLADTECTNQLAGSSDIAAVVGGVVGVVIVVVIVIAVLVFKSRREKLGERSLQSTKQHSEIFMHFSTTSLMSGCRKKDSAILQFTILHSPSLQT